MSRVTDRSIGVRYGMLAVGLLLAAVTSCGGSGNTTASPPGNLGSQAAPSAVAGYGECTDPSCADVARACDDLIRTGCSAPFANGIDPTTLSPGSSDFDAVLNECTLNSYQQLLEDQETPGPGEDLDGGTSEAGPEDVTVVAAELALEEARCTRRATSCDERLNCLRGMTIPAHPPDVDAGAPEDGGVEAAVPEPSWKTPWTATGANPLWSGPPWADAGANSSTYLVPGVDSPSCARCAIERCPTFAYQCFSAEGDAQKCPNHDCCESLRHCIVRRGGYANGAQAEDFYHALAECEIGRPHAAQELANLQYCGEIACAGCQSFDQSRTITGTSNGAWTELDGGP
jgi:hypothetical protein